MPQKGDSVIEARYSQGLCARQVLRNGVPTRTWCITNHARALIILTS